MPPEDSKRREHAKIHRLGATTFRSNERMSRDGDMSLVKQAPSRQSSTRSFADGASETQNEGGFWRELGGWIPGINVFYPIEAAQPKETKKTESSPPQPELPASPRLNPASLLTQVAKQGGQVFDTLYSAWSSDPHKNKKIKKKKLRALAYNDVQVRQAILDEQANCYFNPIVETLQKALSKAEEERWEENWNRRRLAVLENADIIIPPEIVENDTPVPTPFDTEGFADWVYRRVCPPIEDMVYFGLV